MLVKIIPVNPAFKHLPVIYHVCFSTFSGKRVSDPYKDLGIPHHASSDEIKTAYFKLSKQFHPDVNKSSDATRRFTAIANAYEILGKEQSRKQFDSENGTTTYTYTQGASSQKFKGTSHKPNYEFQYKEYEDFKEQLRKNAQKKSYKFSKDDAKRTWQSHEYKSTDKYDEFDENDWLRRYYVQDSKGRWRDKRFYDPSKEEKTFEWSSKEERDKAIKQDANSFIAFTLTCITVPFALYIYLLITR